MMLKKSKEQILSEIRARASSAIYNRLNNNLNMRVDTGSVIYALQEAVAEAIEEGFEVLLENRYTDDDFEKDMTLKP